MRWLPLGVAAALAAFFFFPSADQLVGWGEDPYFNLWNFEFVWSQLGKWGGTGIGQAEFWTTPLYGNFPYSLAFSENQIFPALLSWPLRLLSGNGVWTMNVWALVCVELAILFSWLWLRTLGLGFWAGWGALLFAFSGWFQSQYAHYQHFCYFLFPLAFWSWCLLWDKATRIRILFCGLCFGWAAGWNLYFQVMLNIILGVSVLWGFYRRPDLRLKLLGVLAVAAACELPFFWKYRELEQWAGALSVTAGDFAAFRARFSSFLARPNSPSLLQKWVPFYPNPALGIEAAGFVGITWMAIVWKARRSLIETRWKILLFAALIAFWISLGPDAGVFYFFRWIPGLGALRAVGRFQILFATFSLPVVLAYLQSLPRGRAFALLSLILLEFAPAQGPRHETINLKLFTESTDFTRWLADHPSFREKPALPLPFGDVQIQLALLPVGLSTWGGYTGRTPLNVAMLAYEMERWNADSRIERWENAYAYAGVERVLIANETIARRAEEQIRAISTFPWKSNGCFDHFQFRFCLFERAGTSHETPRVLDLAKESTWEMLPGLPPAGILRSQNQGYLDFKTLNSCFWRRQIKLQGLPGWSSDRSLPPQSLKGIRFAAGDKMMELSSKPVLGSWPQTQNYSIVCGRK